MTDCVFTKVAYPTESAAIEALRIIRRESTRKHRPARAYQCDACGQWHLTKRKAPERVGRARRRRMGKW